MPSGNVPSGTIDARSAKRGAGNFWLLVTRIFRLRQRRRHDALSRHWYQLSFRTLLTLVCLQVFVLLAAGVGLLISAQQKRVQLQNQRVPLPFDTLANAPARMDSVADAQTDLTNKSVPTVTLAATEDTAATRAPSRLEEDLADNVKVLPEGTKLADIAPAEVLPAIGLANTEIAEQHMVRNAQAIEPLQRVAQPDLADSSAAPAKIDAPFQKLVMSQPIPPAASAQARGAQAPRTPKRATRAVTSAEQPPASETRHRTVVRKRRWENAERRAAARGETAAAR